MELPFSLPANSRVLVTGAGGGFDVFCALPVALQLKENGHEVHLGNYSFTNLEAVRGALTEKENLYGITGDSTLAKGDYFPELQLSRWWERTFAEKKAIWCYSRIGVRPLSQIFQHLQTTLNLDAIVVLDGGIDGLFKGNEFDLATPSMDAISIIAASTVTKCTKIYAFTAFGTEGAESKVRHADALLRISELTASDAFFGVTALTKNSTIGRQFIEAVDNAHNHLPASQNSVIASSIVESLKGKFGNCRFNAKTQVTPVWISALTSLYWFFDLDAVAKAKPYRNEVLETDNVTDVSDAIEKTRARMGVLPRADIPI
ncbi:MAG: hypothetical protein QG574_5088 [Cyanobacteriota bacterium erpe_2018_sw_21hr_WHONDRS-SW48-000092_B_bin.40]|jgi:hypothetical protein|nr:hypothetical protein [Cyanobacteriota bacterium erpe_2018_sw_21hr_WHONDRS-SW48-000092_B_bin.40]